MVEEGLINNRCSIKDCDGAKEGWQILQFQRKGGKSRKEGRKKGRQIKEGRERREGKGGKQERKGEEE
jgi:hypothetical protein